MSVHCQLQPREQGLLSKRVQTLNTGTEHARSLSLSHSLSGVRRAGAEHSLTPLRYAMPPGQAVVISEPTLFLGALWLPHFKDQRALRAALAELAAVRISYANPSSAAALVEPIGIEPMT